MTTGTPLNLQSSIDLYELKMTVGAYYVSADYQSIVIPYVGYANPSDSTVDIISAQYTLPTSTTWLDMTPNAGTQTTNLSFTSDGTALSYIWDSKTDIGSSMYNTSIRIRFLVNGLLGDSLYATKTVLITRTIVVPTTASSAVQFPSDYSGIFGNSLLTNAPKIR